MGNSAGRPSVMTEPHVWDQLTGISSTPSYDTGGVYAHHTVQLVIVGDVDIDYAVQGSLDGTNWFDIATGNDITTSTIEVIVTMALVYIRVDVPAEHGTGNTIDASYLGVR